MSYATDYDDSKSDAADEARMDVIQDSVDTMTKAAHACYTQADALAAITKGMSRDLLRHLISGEALAAERITTIVQADLSAHVKAYIEREADDAAEDAEREAAKGAPL